MGIILGLQGAGGVTNWVEALKGRAALAVCDQGRGRPLSAGLRAIVSRCAGYAVQRKAGASMDDAGVPPIRDVRSINADNRAISDPVP